MAIKKKLAMVDNRLINGYKILSTKFIAVSQSTSCPNKFTVIENAICIIIRPIVIQRIHFLNFPIASSELLLRRS